MMKIKDLEKEDFDKAMANARAGLPDVDYFELMELDIKEAFFWSATYEGFNYWHKLVNG